MQLYYKDAAANYVLELLRIQLQPENTGPYIKARDEYKKIITLIETLYPIEEKKEVLIIKEESALPVSTQTAPTTIPSSKTVLREDKTKTN